MAKLSVNINKIATLRNARGKDVPNVLRVAQFLERHGVDGITVHPRPDGRHIRRQDVLDLKEHLRVELNIEGYPSDDFLDLVALVLPDQVTLVPDPPEAITSSAGWRWDKHSEVLKSSLVRLGDLGLRVSLFMDPWDYGQGDLERMESLGADRVELYTERYADSFGTPAQSEVLAVYRDFSHKVIAAGMELNAGHDLTARNVRTLLESVPEIQEVSIGHAFVADALEWGLKETLDEYKKAVDLSQPFRARAKEIGEFL